MNENIKELAETVSSLDSKSRVALFKKVIEDVNKDEVEELYHIVCSRYLPASNIRNWIESRFEKDLSLTPMRVASEIRHHKRIDSRMMPYLIKTAQRTKNRIRMRLTRAIMDSSDN